MEFKLPTVTEWLSLHQLFRRKSLFDLKRAIGERLDGTLPREAYLINTGSW